jgi:predicted phosphodiesterase
MVGTVLKSTLVDVEVFLERLPPVEVYTVEVAPKLWGTGPDNYQLVFAVSDWHVGAHADLEEVARRLVCAFDNALAHMACLPIDAEQMPITLLVGGDMLDGVMGDMHEGQAGHQYSHGVEQVSSYVSQICTLIRYLFDLTSHPIEVWSVPGNHDRTAKDRKGDSDRILHDIIGQWIASAVDGLANVHMPERGHTILTGRLGHNTQLILYHGDTQPKDWRRTLLMHMDKSATHYLLVCGHRHTPEARIMEDLNVMLYQVGSPKAGLDRYAPDVIGVDSRPSQQILLIGPHGPQLPGQVFL